MVRALYSGISRGTEALVFRGRVPPSEHERMSAPFQSGAFPAPIKYGYASVGIVERGPGDLQGPACVLAVPASDPLRRAGIGRPSLPPAVPPQRAVLAANLETAINGLWDASPRIGDRVVVVGAGTVGSLVAWLAGRIPGCDVELVDVNPKRAAVAGALGVRFVEPEAVAGGADVVMHASGSAAGLALALRIAAFEATIVEMSWYGDQAVPLPLGQAFHARPPDDQIVAGRHRRLVAARAMGLPAPDGARAGVARRPGARCAHHRRERTSTRCRR